MPAERVSDCDFLAGAYDYARAARLMGALRLSEGRLSGPGPFLLMVIPDDGGIHVAGLDISRHALGDFNRFIDAWGSASRTTQEQVSQAPDQPGLARSIVNLISAILRTAGGGVAGLIQGGVSTP
ncbi:hypothetical protein F0Q34_16360 [Pseudoroseomonas oryzae]|uniref:Uncharacterized protein n=2 Tax=Teichococcus oryzae TaxID=1608942 RepID=A0A5B2TCI6_9PROT|nr:hypothetical protein F0Q34_16360 [Pseudoroseomonas oryzae]